MATKKPKKLAKSRTKIKDLEPKDAKPVKGGDTKTTTTTTTTKPVPTIEVQSYSWG